MGLGGCMYMKPGYRAYICSEGQSNTERNYDLTLMFLWYKKSPAVGEAFIPD